MLYLNTIGVDIFIRKYKNKSCDSFWNNYELVLWEKNISGYFSLNGMYHKNAWGISSKFNINEDGLWRLPKKYVKYFK